MAPSTRTASLALLALAFSASTRAADGDQASHVPFLHDVSAFGRFHEDYSQHHMDDRLPKAPVNGPYTRRARLGAKGEVGERWAWDLEYDFANNVTVPKDVKVRYTFGNGSRVFVGHQKQPFNLSLEMSSNDLPFAERAVDNKLVDAVADRAYGVRFEQHGKHWFFAGGAFSEIARADHAGNDHWATVGRLVWQPFDGEERVLHLGLRALYRSVDTLDPMSFAAKTTAGSDLKIVNTGDIAQVDAAMYHGPEFALAQGSLLIFGEYNAATLTRPDAPALHFSSWHLAAAWSLTGENRSSAYALNAGEFKGIVPSRPFNPEAGHWGAFELAARAAAIDLNDADITGGREQTVNLSFNWYFNSHARALIDWTHIVDTDDSSALRRFAQGGDFFTLRAQYTF